MKEVVTHYELLRELSLRQIVRVYIAEYEAAVVAPGNEFVHLAAVDLKLLVIEAVDYVPGQLVRRNVLRHIIGSNRQVCRESGVRHRRADIIVDRLGQDGDGGAVLVHLGYCRCGIGNAIWSRGIRVQNVQAPGVLVSYYD